MRKYSLADRLFNEFDNMLRTVVPANTTTVSTARPLPTAQAIPALSVQDARVSAALMRINHTGEVCAQALYNGQAFTAKTPQLAQNMAQAAAEELDHLAWCEQRLNELDSYASRLNPLWYGMSFALGALAGAAGDKYSLGFVAETERQVSAHLQAHLQQLPAADTRSQHILQHMEAEERVHRAQALAQGAAELPSEVTLLMTLVSKVMTKTAYYI